MDARFSSAPVKPPATSNLYRVNNANSIPPYTSLHRSRRTHALMTSRPYSVDSRLSPDVDPHAVDYRSFCSYMPNEIKHRRRTSPQQIKRLEEVFFGPNGTTKPSASLRIALSDELGMTPRGVQVWFQNRRAKEKGLKKKLAAAAKTRQDNGGGSGGSAASTEEQPDEPTRASPANREHGSSSPAAPATSPASEVRNAPTPPSASSSSQTPNASPRSAAPILSDAHLLNLRRSSLPAFTGPTSPVDPLSPYHRRGSVDTSILRLKSHPYAQQTILKNDELLKPQRRPIHRAASSNFPQGRTNPAHRMSLPYASSPLCPPNNGPAASPARVRYAHMNQFGRASIPDTGMHHVAPSRVVSLPIPGPLPSPGFTFGNPSGSAGSSPTPEHHRYGHPAEETDVDDDTASSYSFVSRFGSVASMSSSISYNSEVGSAGGFDPRMRRDSCNHSSMSGQFVERMAGLDVNGIQPGESSPGVVYLPEDPLVVPSHHADDADNQSAYSSSPASTVGPDNLQRRGSTSELAHALHASPEPIADGQPSYPAPAAETVADVRSPSEQDFAYYDQAGCSVYPASASGSSSSSSLSLPVVMEVPEKFQYGFDQKSHYNCGGQYPVMHEYPDPSAVGSGGLCGTDGAYVGTGDAQEVIELHHAMEYGGANAGSSYCSTEMYPSHAYAHPSAVDAGAAPLLIDPPAMHHTVDAYGGYT
ncbi:hypothetical protein PLICRDRAFT_27790 [Plicaturopsis crispa FD-325 SS-3]|nr:hypothetical protein PLICRDRAFT_27790 [Plicaturopsis crispa FD-325 SS-3]